MKTSVIGYPRIGALRELKFETERYFRNEITGEALKEAAQTLRAAHWKVLAGNGIDGIPSNDFSFYDNMLDLAVLLNVIPQRYRDLHLDSMATYFAMARGYQGPAGDVKALAMKKWFNTNYHYLVPELDETSNICLVGEKPFEEFREAKALGILTRPVLIGPYTFLKLARIKEGCSAADNADKLIIAYAELLQRLGTSGAEWVQIDEPALVLDMEKEDKALFVRLYRALLPQKGFVQVLLQTYFGDIRDVYKEVLALDFDGIGLDFVEGKETLNLVRSHQFPKATRLFAGIVNGKNVWRNDYAKTLELIQELQGKVETLVLSSGCSLLHVPYSLAPEKNLDPEVRMHLAFAEEKLSELEDLKRLAVLSETDLATDAAFLENKALFQEKRGVNVEVRKKISLLSEQDFVREPSFKTRAEAQKAYLKLPLLPTTTIGSFPQTDDVKINRAKFRKGEIGFDEYNRFVKQKISECIQLQENLGLDVLVHGEYERNDMVEYFGENLAGFVFTEKAWVQSYGTRCVKPPIIFGDVSRKKAITVDYSVYANSLTSKPVKGMLTGPVTILNWSFPREDIALSEITYQIALAMREEVLELEANGVPIIQIDEAALKEKLPLRKADWHSEYLDWAIRAFRLVHAKVKPTTQIHTHMCYSEFGAIVQEIDAMDADVISFEASRSNLSLVDVLQKNHFKTAVGPGVYDIHSPRVPSVEEIETALEKILQRLPQAQVWVNPDCGLKTRGEKETIQSLAHLVQAAHRVREKITFSP